jgi:hypothetical protein
MIVFDLKCGAGHVFETWLKDSETYERQAAAGAIVCPHCGDTRVGKALMAPNVATGGGKARETHLAGPMPAKAKAYLEALGAMRRHVEANSDDVGERFAEEARKIHYGETDSRNIRGEATEDEASALADEGVEFERIPWLPRHDA